MINSENVTAGLLSELKEAGILFAKSLSRQPPREEIGVRITQIKFISSFLASHNESSRTGRGEK